MHEVTLLWLLFIVLQCTPPGLIYGRAGKLRAKNKVLILQVNTVALNMKW